MSASACIYPIGPGSPESPPNAHLNTVPGLHQTAGRMEREELALLALQEAQAAVAVAGGGCESQASSDLRGSQLYQPRHDLRPHTQLVANYGVMSSEKATPLPPPVPPLMSALAFTPTFPSLTSPFFIPLPFRYN